LPGLGALALLATQARADEKVEQKSETKSDSYGKKVKKHRESKRTMDTDNGAVTAKSHDEPGNDAKVKEKTKVEKDSAGNVTTSETKMEKK
jgi:hypothetical protein